MQQSDEVGDKKTASCSPNEANTIQQAVLSSSQSSICIVDDALELDPWIQAWVQAGPRQKLESEHRKGGRSLFSEPRLS